MKKKPDELKKGTAANSISLNSRTKEIKTFSDITEVVEYYNARSNDLNLGPRQRKRYRLLYDFAAEPGRTLAEFDEKLEDEREKKRLEARQSRQKKREEKAKARALVASTEQAPKTKQAPKKKKKNVYPKIEDCKSKEEIRSILEKKQENASDSYKKSLQTFINMVNNPNVTLKEAKARIGYSKAKHSMDERDYRRLNKVNNSKPSRSTTAPIQTSSRSQSSSTPAPPRPQSLVIQTSPKSQPLNVRTSTNLSDSIVQAPRSQHPGARISTNSPISNVQEVPEIRSPITQTSPKSKSPNIKRSPKSPNLNMQRIPKLQSPQNEERRDSNESIPRYLYEGVDNEEDWMSVWGLDYE